MKRMPWSVKTNIAYMLTGLALFFYVLTNWLVLAAGLSFLLLAFGSSMFHQFGTKQDEKLDEIGMYAVFLSITILALQHWIPIPSVAGIAFVLIVAIGMWWRIGNINSFEKIGYMLCFIYFLLLLGRFWWTIGLSLLLFAIAFVIRQIGEEKKGTVQQDQLHAVWHILSDAALTIIVFSLVLAK